MAISTRLPVLFLIGGLALKSLTVLLWRTFRTPGVLDLLTTYDPGAFWFAERVSALVFDQRRIAPSAAETIIFELMLILAFGVECLLVGFLVAWLVRWRRRAVSALPSVVITLGLLICTGSADGKQTGGAFSIAETEAFRYDDRPAADLRVRLASVQSHLDTRSRLRISRQLVRPCTVWGRRCDSSSGLNQFTGKERDAETGLDYFGARYFSGAQGRFTSPDPLLSSGRPWLPQSWNRYAYTLNNPLRYTDPLGLYEWDKKCKQGDSTCDANRQQFRDSLANLTKAAGTYAAGSKERKQLDAIIGKIGTEGDGNKTRIGFNANMKDFGQTFGNKMTFNFQAMNTALSQWDSGTVSTAGAALVGHEGQHLVDGTGGLGGLKYLLNMGDERARQEIQPFTVESYVFQGFNKLEPFGYGTGVSKGDASGWPLWNPSWAAAEADKLRQANVQKVVEELYGKKK